MQVLTEDHPEANGRVPQSSDVEYILKFLLEDGTTLEVRMGTKGFENITNLLFDMLSNRPSHEDGKILE